MSSSYDAANRLTRREMHTSSSMRLAMDYAYTDADELLSVTRRNGSNTPGAMPAAFFFYL